MWVFTDVADWFDKERESNARFLENAANNTDDDFLGALAWTGIGLARVLNTGAGGLASGFIDVLRIGDGVKEGGWGYGKDTLRALAIVGPALRIGRYGLSLVAALDAAPTASNCGWVAAARAARMTGTKHFATVGSLAQALGVPAAETGGTSMAEIARILQAIGGETKLLRAAASFEEIEQIARANPEGVVVFGVRFFRATQVAGRPGLPPANFLSGELHALVAKYVGGTVYIVDRSGKVYRSLDALAKVYSAEQMLSMTIHAQGAVLVAKNLRLIGGVSFTTAITLLNVLAYEVRSVPNPLVDTDLPISLKTGIENLYGWWWFNMDGGIRCYRFARDKTARWFDIHNHRSGQGQWSEKADHVEVLWSATGTREKWTYELTPSKQTGTSTAAGKTSTFVAARVWDSFIAGIVGRWQVNCDRWIWNIDFTEDGNVRWSDFYTPSENGRRHLASHEGGCLRDVGVRQQRRMDHPGGRWQSERKDDGQWQALPVDRHEGLTLVLF